MSKTLNAIRFFTQVLVILGDVPVAELSLAERRMKATATEYLNNAKQFTTR